MGRVEAICISAKKGEKKSPQLSARFIMNHGMEGDAHAGPWHRQISLLAAEDVEAMRQRALPGLKAGDFAENVLVSGVDLGALGLGTCLRIGGKTELTLTQLGKVCHRRCAIYYQAGDCIMPRLGVFSRVVRGGTVATDDPVEVLEVVPRTKPQAVLLNIGSRAVTETPDSAVKHFVQEVLQAHIYASEVLPDNRDELAARLRHYSSGHSIDLVLVSDGTSGMLRGGGPGFGIDAGETPTFGLKAVPPATESTGTLAPPAPVLRNDTLIVGLPGAASDAIKHLLTHLPALTQHCGTQHELSRRTESGNRRLTPLAASSGRC